MSRNQVYPAPPANTLQSFPSPPIKSPKPRKLSLFSSPPSWYPLKILDSLAAFLALLSFSLAYYENTGFYEKVEEGSGTEMVVVKASNETTKVTEGLRGVNSGITAGLLVLVGWRWSLYRRLLREERKTGQLCTCSSLTSLISELLLCSLHCPPGLNSTFHGSMLDGSYEYSWDSILFTLMLVRGYLLLRLFHHYSRWTEPAARVLGEKLRVDVGISWAIRAEFKDRPYRTVGGLTVITVCGCAVALRVFERSYSGGTHCVTDLQYQTNAMWALIITMTTVGYGDAYPSTHLGRLVATLCCLLGMLLVSLMVLSLTIHSSLSTQEMKAFLKIKRVKTSESIKENAADVIKSVLRLCRVQKSGGGGKMHRLSMSFLWVVKLKRCIRLFSDRHKRDTANHPPVEDVLLQLGRKFKHDLKDLKSVSNSCKSLRTRCDLLNDRSQALQLKLAESQKVQEASARLILALHNAIAAGRMRLETRPVPN